jgi:hypothetical protein
MVRVRENTHTHLTRHIVTTVLVCAALAAPTIELHAMDMVAGKRKEAAP